MGVISRAEFERLQREGRRERDALDAQIDAAREAARREGYREGFGEGRAEALALYAGDLAALRRDLDEAHEALIAELGRLAGRALGLLAQAPVPDGFVEAAVLQAVREAGGLSPIRLLVSFEDEAALAGSAVASAGVVLACDALLGPGEMILETPRGRHAIGWMAQLSEIAGRLAEDADA